MIDQNSNIDDIIKISNNAIKKNIQSFYDINKKIAGNKLYLITSTGYYNKNSLANKNIMISEKIIIDDQIFKISRHLLSFTQTDDTIRTLCHNIIYKLFIKYNKQFDTGVLIGGEMYIYGKIAHKFFKNKIYISDTHSIISDSIINDPNKSTSIYHLVNYSTINFNWNISPNSIAILNVSAKGFGTNLCEQIIKIKPNILISIWCNYKALEKDYKLLSNTYQIINMFRYKTNYEVFILVFQLII